MKHQSAYTLIELMIVVALISTIALFAVPAYKTYVWKTYVEEAKGAMRELANRAEMVKAQSFTYRSSQLVDLPGGTKDYSTYRDGQRFYKIQMQVDASGQLYEITLELDHPMFNPNKHSDLRLDSLGRTCIKAERVSGAASCTVGTDPGW